MTIISFKKSSTPCWDFVKCFTATVVPSDKIPCETKQRVPFN
jgi:hypothetical protein